MNKAEFIKKIYEEMVVEIPKEMVDVEVLDALFGVWREAEAMQLATSEMQWILLKENADILWTRNEEIFPHIKDWENSKKVYELMIYFQEEHEYFANDLFERILQPYKAKLKCHEIARMALDRVEALRQRASELSDHYTIEFLANMRIVDFCI